MNIFILTNCKTVNMKGPELKIEFRAYYNDKKEKFDEGGLYPFLEYCQSSKPKDVVVRIDYDMDFDEIDIYCESLAISNLSYEKIDDRNFVAKFTCDSKSGKPLMRVIYALGEAGNCGHSYAFTVGKEKFGFDGDGADRIMKINDVKFQKIKSSYDLGKVWNDTTRKNNEEIDNNMSVNIEEIVKQSIKNIVNESHGKKKHNAPKDTLAAMRKGNREADQDMYGGGFRQTKKVHKAKNDYDRKNNKVDLDKLDRYDESVKKINYNDLLSIISESVAKHIKVLKEDFDSDNDYEYYICVDGYNINTGEIKNFNGFNDDIFDNIEDCLQTIEYMLTYPKQSSEYDIRYANDCVLLLSISVEHHKINNIVYMSSLDKQYFKDIQRKLPNKKIKLV